MNSLLNIKPDVFKKCPMCGFQWDSRKAFLEDASVDIIGYMPHFEKLTAGLFMFNHSCKTTFSIKAAQFKDLYDGPIFRKRAKGTKACPGYCMNKDELRPCPAQCDCAYVRDIIQLIKNWPKG